MGCTLAVPSWNGGFPFWIHGMSYRNSQKFWLDWTISTCRSRLTTILGGSRNESFHPESMMQEMEAKVSQLSANSARLAVELGTWRNKSWQIVVFLLGFPASLRAEVQELRQRRWEEWGLPLFRKRLEKLFLFQHRWNFQYRKFRKIREFGAWHSVVDIFGYLCARHRWMRLWLFERSSWCQWEQEQWEPQRTSRFFRVESKLLHIFAHEMCFRSIWITKSLLVLRFLQI